MRQAILIRVKPANFEVWVNEHLAASDARKEYGMTDGPIYRETANPNIALVHLDVESMERAMEWFKSDRFREGVKRAGIVERELWIAQKREAPPRSGGTPQG